MAWLTVPRPTERTALPRQRSTKMNALLSINDPAVSFLDAQAMRPFHHFGGREPTGHSISHAVCSLVGVAPRPRPVGFVVGAK